MRPARCPDGTEAETAAGTCPFSSPTAASALNSSFKPGSLRSKLPRPHLHLILALALALARLAAAGGAGRALLAAPLLFLLAALLVFLLLILLILLFGSLLLRRRALAAIGCGAAPPLALALRGLLLQLAEAVWGLRLARHCRSAGAADDNDRPHQETAVSGSSARAAPVWRTTALPRCSALLATSAHLCQLRGAVFSHHAAQRLRYRLQHLGCRRVSIQPHHRGQACTRGGHKVPKAAAAGRSGRRRWRAASPGLANPALAAGNRDPCSPAKIFFSFLFAAAIRTRATRSAQTTGRRHTPSRPSAAPELILGMSQCAACIRSAEWPQYVEVAPAHGRRAAAAAAAAQQEPHAWSRRRYISHPATLRISTSSGSHAAGLPALRPPGLHVSGRSGHCRAATCRAAVSATCALAHEGRGAGRRRSGGAPTCKRPAAAPYRRPVAATRPDVRRLCALRPPGRRAAGAGGGGGSAAAQRAHPPPRPHAQPCPDPGACLVADLLSTRPAGQPQAVSAP